MAARFLTDDAMRRPLFVEQPEDSVRSDPYSGPLGFMLGGMGLPTKIELSQQYFDAANTLIQTIRKWECEDYKLVYPVLFLYRHALELMLKWIMHSTANHHKLDVLADDFVNFVQINYNQKVPAWITNRIKEFSHIDPNSMAFRYAEDKYSGSKKCSGVDDGIYVDVIHLQQAMAALYGTLAVVAGKICNVDVV